MVKSLPLVVLFVAACLSASSQEVVHALTGTVSSINSASKTITVFQDNGKTGVFDDAAAGKVRIAFDKKLAQQTTEVASFTNQGAYAIVFYYGFIDHPIVVAIKPLGKGPFASTEGTLESFNGRDHSVSIADSTGAVKTFKLTADSVAEGNLGAVEASRLQARKGDHVRVVSQDVDGSPTALFIKDI
jgi:hypothetical protein